MSTINPKFIKVVAELKAQFSDLSSQELGELALRYYELENQTTVINSTQPPKPEQKVMSKQAFQNRLSAIDSQINKLEGSKMFKTPSDLKRINQSLDELHQIRNQFIAEFAMNTYEDP